MPERVQAPNGEIVEFPDGTDDATITRVMRQHYTTGVRATPQYEQARANERRVASARRSSPGMGGAVSRFADQVTGSLGVRDEIAGASAALAQPLRNLVRGENIPMATAFRAAADQANADTADYARRAPIANAAATVAGVAASGVPHVAAAAPRLGQYAVGAGLSAGFGAAQGDNAEERARNAVVGGGLGVAGTAAGEALGAGLGLLTRGGRDPSTRAARIANRYLRDANITPQEISRRSGALRRQGGVNEELGFELMGVPGERMARAVANVRGPGQQIAETALSARNSGVRTPRVRVLEEATRGTRPRQTRAPTNYWDALQTLKSARSGQARTAYQAAYAQPVDAAIYANELRPLMTGGPVQQSAARLGSEIADAELLRPQARVVTGGGNAAMTEMSDALLARQHLAALADGAAPDAINARAIDYYQRGLRQLAEREGVRTQLGSAYAASRDAFNEVSKRAAPGLHDAMRTYGSSMRIEDLMEEGRQIFSRSEGQVDQILGGGGGQGLTTEELDGFMLGVMDAIETKVNAGDTAFVTRLMKNQNWRSALTRALGGESASRRFMNRIAREARMRTSDNAIRAGSRTTPLREDILAMTAGEDELGFLAEFIQSGGQVRPFVLRKAAEAWQRLRDAGIRDPRVNEELARRLFARNTRGNTQELIQWLETQARAPALTPQAQTRATGLGLIGGAAARERVR